jgi:hypothetical protein
MIDEGCDPWRVAQVRVRKKIPASGEFFERRQNLHECLLRIAERGRQWRNAYAGAVARDKVARSTQLHLSCNIGYLDATRNAN